MAVPSDPAQALLQRQVTFNPPQAQTQASFTASIAGNVLTVTVFTSGSPLAAGQQLAGAGLPQGLQIVRGADAGLSGAQIPGVIPVVGGGTPTGSGPGGAGVPSAPSTGVVTGISGTLQGDSGATGNVILTGTGGVGTYLLNQNVGTIASEAMTAAAAQVNTGPAVTTNSNPIDGAQALASGAATATAPIAPGAVGYAARALPYSPGATFTANTAPATVAGVNNPAVGLPANANEQQSYGDSVINTGMRQGSMSDSGMVTAKQG